MVLIDYSKVLFKTLARANMESFHSHFLYMQLYVLAHQWQIVMDELLKNISEPNGMTN